MDAVHRHVPQAARPVHRPGAGHRHQAHAAPLRLPEDQRRLQPPLHLLHHPQHARRPGVAADRRRARRCARAVRVRREGTAGHQPGHQRLRRRREVPHRLLRRPAGEDAAARPVRRGWPTWPQPLWRLGAAALRLPVPACRRHPAADGRRPRAALPGRALPARPPRRAQAHEAPGQRRAQPGAAGALARDLPRDSSCARPSSPAFRARPRPSSRPCSTSCARRRSTAPAASPIRRCRARPPTSCRASCRRKCARSAARASWPWPKQVSMRQAAAPRGRHHAGAGGPRAGAGPQGRRRPQLRRRARDRRPGAPAAAREGLQDAEGGRVHARPHRRPPRATTSSALPI